MKKLLLLPILTVILTKTSIIQGSLLKNFSDKNSDTHLQNRADTFLKKIEETFEKVTIKDSVKTFVIKIKLPGYKKKDIKIIIDTKNHKLKISAKQHETKEEQQKQTNQDVRIYIHKKQEKLQDFYRTISIPNNLNLKTINTTYKNNLLIIGFEKIKEKNKQNIRVELQ
jgi:HSP20 family molecular chaperone IbpA